MAKYKNNFRFGIKQEQRIFKEEKKPKIAVSANLGELH
jgi:hypothetical protein